MTGRRLGVGHPLSSVLSHKPSCSAPPFFPVHVLGLHPRGCPPAWLSRSDRRPLCADPRLPEAVDRAGRAALRAHSPGRGASGSPPRSPSPEDPSSSSLCTSVPATHTSLFQTKLVAALSMRSQPSAANSPSLHPRTLCFSFPTLSLLLFAKADACMCAESLWSCPTLCNANSWFAILHCLLDEA